MGPRHLGRREPRAQLQGLDVRRRDSHCALQSCWACLQEEISLPAATRLKPPEKEPCSSCRGMDGRVQGAVLFKDQSQTWQLWRCYCKKRTKTWTQMQEFLLVS